MKREIMFRGKIICKEPDWEYGFYFQRTTQYGNKKYYILEGNPNRARLRDCFRDVWEVYPETVGQFTGLHDKNGKEIYEGDVLYISCLKEENPFVVECWKYKYMFRSPKIHSSKEAYEPCYWESGEVIGNIHDNPELLKTE